jgi:hypothetical protein
MTRDEIGALLDRHQEALTIADCGLWIGDWDWGLGIGDWRLEIGDCRTVSVPHLHIFVVSAFRRTS